VRGGYTDSLCPECGPHVTIDEDGCCSGCGCTATGEGAEQVFADLAAWKCCAEELAEALRGLESKSCAGEFCDHAMPPCHRCDACAMALAAFEKLKGEKP
jgi:hypothetical protein